MALRITSGSVSFKRIIVSVGEVLDWGLVTENVTEGSEDYGLIIQSVTSTDNFGLVTESA